MFLCDLNSLYGDSPQGNEHNIAEIYEGGWKGEGESPSIKDMEARGVYQQVGC